MRYIAVLIAVGGLVLAAPTTPAACPAPVIAYTDSVEVEETWIIIGSPKTPSTQSCGLETLNSVWSYAINTSCSASGTPRGARVWGNNLSGTYKIVTVADNCVELCQCTP